MSCTLYLSLHVRPLIRRKVRWATWQQVRSSMIYGKYYRQALGRHRQGKLTNSCAPPGIAGQWPLSPYRKGLQLLHCEFQADSASDWCKWCEICLSRKNTSITDVILWSNSYFCILTWYNCGPPKGDNPEVEFLSVLAILSRWWVCCGL